MKFYIIYLFNEISTKNLSNQPSNDNDDHELDKQRINELEEQVENQQETINEHEQNEQNLQKKIKKLKNKLSSVEKNYQEQLTEKTNELKQLQQKAHEACDNPKDEGKLSNKPISDGIQISHSESIENFEKMDEIGSNKIGKVFKVAKFYALKEMNIDIQNISDFDSFIKVNEIMSQLNHPNILKTLKVNLNDSIHPSILLEFAQINLEQAIKEKVLTKPQIVCIIYQIIEGMKYAHFQRVIHRHLKPTNILICSNNIIKISDFGIEKLFSLEDQNQYCDSGYQKFMAPEIIDESEYDEKCDVYSFGVLTFYILSSGKIPKIKVSEILQGKKAKIPESFTEFATQLISNCWNFNANDRPSFDHILKDFEKNSCNLIKLKKSECNEVKNFIKKHKEKIPVYGSRSLGSKSKSSSKLPPLNKK